MIDLNDAGALASADPAGMLATAGALAKHCRSGYAVGRSVGLDRSARTDAVVFCGMGGSGVAGDVVRAVFGDRLAVPIVVVRAAEVPAFCGPDTLVVASSYTGGTAETLEAFDAAVERRCRVAGITSGGALGERDAAAIARIPSGLMPRAAFGLLVFAAVGVLEAAGLLGDVGEDVLSAMSELDGVVPTLGPNVPASVNEAKRAAAAIADRVPVVWGEEGIASTAATRWKTQMNENAKVPSIASSLPELDHNEVVGWSSGAGRPFCVVALRHEGERPDDAVRFGPSLEIARDAGAEVIEVWARGSSPLSRFLSLVAIGDHASVYLAALRGVDPTPIDAIVRLKQALAGA